ncbi:MAG: RsmB/NOP family class I SAM-dependent RNA methyltransferase [Candidatus Micrarchaeota archaeon]
MLPQGFRDRYCPVVDDAAAFGESLGRPLPRSFRVNTLKSSPPEVMEGFSGYGIEIKQMPWYGDAFVSENPDVGSTLEHFSGEIYMQELVSMLPPLLVREELSRARLVLDGCAAPGSKTTQLSALMGNRGTVVANDIDYSRIRALKFNLEKVGALNVVITNQDLRMFPNSQFDVIILDAPCSAEGTIRKSPDLLRFWSDKGYPGHSRLQGQLLRRAFDLLAPGGVLVYSTCTFAPEENEFVIEKLLQDTDASLEEVGMDGFRLSPALPAWHGAEFSPEVRKCARVWPHHNDTGGFFLAKVRK